MMRQRPERDRLAALVVVRRKRPDGVHASRAESKIPLAAGGKAAGDEASVGTSGRD
jgi:hypothetical protein